MTQDGSISSQERRRSRRWWAWTRRAILTLVALLVALGLLGWAYVAWVNHRGDQAVAAALEHLRRQQLPGSPGELLAASLAAKRPSGRHLYAAGELAAGQAEAEYRSLPILGEAKTPEFGKPVPVEMGGQLAKFVENSKAYFALLDEAQAIDERQDLLSPEAGSNPQRLLSFQAESIKRLSQLRDAVKRRMVASLAAQAAGKPDEAMRSIAKAFWLGSTFDGQMSLLNAMTRGSADALVVSGLEECLGRSQSQPQSLQGVRDAMLHEEAAIDFRDIVKGDVANIACVMAHPDVLLAMNTVMSAISPQVWEESHKKIAAIQRSLNGTPSNLDDAIGPEITRSAVRRALALQWTWAYVCPGAYRQYYAAQMEKTLASLDLASKPNAEIARWAAQARQKGDSSERAIPPRGVTMLLDVKAVLRVAAVALSVEAHRMEHGDWPTDLAAVKDGQLADPFTDQPLKYARTAQGVVVYSVGRSFQDHVGKVHAGEDDDVVFKLLNTDLRNK